VFLVSFAGGRKEVGVVGFLVIKVGLNSEFNHGLKTISMKIKKGLHPHEGLTLSYSHEKMIYPLQSSLMARNSSGELTTTCVPSFRVTVSGKTN
jgi:hypothetical protein